MSSPYESTCLLLILLFHAASAEGDTFSQVVGYMNVDIAKGSTKTVSNPFQRVDGPLDAPAVKDQLAAAADDTDLLHVWVGEHFISYEQVVGHWTIRGTQTEMPDVRVPVGVGSGILLSRRAEGSSVLKLGGSLSDAPHHTIVIPASSWRLLSHPYGLPMDADILIAAGAQVGDRIKVWSPAGNNWITHMLGDEGAPEPLAPGQSLLFFNSSSVDRPLTFTKPVQEANR